MQRMTSLFSTLLLATLVLAGSAAFAAESQKVNINEADASQLALLPRVGPSLSARIIEFREENGKFKSPGDLMLVRGIGEKTYALMRPYITVSGETTLTEKLRVSQIEAAREADDSDESKE
ncbi:MAG: helix-hairpin-helix domain-containing protein [Acidobacteriota bacterium]